MPDPTRILHAWICNSPVRRDDVDLVRIMLDAIQDRFRERTVIASQLIEPAIAIILRTKDG